MPANKTQTGAQALTRVLQQLDVGTVFSLGGASHTHLLAAIEDAGIDIVSSRHETGTVAAADGYARVTGKLGVALIIAEQGAPNAMTGILNAWHANSPVLVLVARLPMSWTEARAETDLDKHEFVASITKYSRSVLDASRIAEYTADAAHRALSGVPGPTLLVIPQEVFTAEVLAKDMPLRTVCHAGPDTAAVEAACDVLATAKRPLVIAGAGARRGNASKGLQALAAAGIPVLGNSGGRGLVTEDHVTGFSWPYGLLAAADADVVIVAGARLKQRLGFGLPPRFAADARFIQLADAGEEFHRNRAIDIPILGHIGASAEALANGICDQGLSWDPAWVANHLTVRDEKVAKLAAKRGEPIHPLALASALNEALPEDAIFVGDGASIQNFMYGGVRLSAGSQFMDHYPLGSMGIGTPLVLGAAAAARELAKGGKPRPVVLVTGDGSLGFYLAELASLAQAKFPVAVVVGNDQAWGTEKHGQERAIGRTVNTELSPQHFEKVAEGLGLKGVSVSTLDGFEDALKEALAGTGPTLFNVWIDREAGAGVKEDPDLAMIRFSDLASAQDR